MGPIISLKSFCYQIVLFSVFGIQNKMPSTYDIPFLGPFLTYAPPLIRFPPNLQTFLLVLYVYVISDFHEPIYPPKDWMAPQWRNSTSNLSLFSLLYRKRSIPGPPVFLAHGLTSSSAQWVFGPPEKSLGLLLADAGK